MFGTQYITGHFSGEGWSAVGRITEAVRGTVGRLGNLYT